MGYYESSTDQRSELTIWYDNQLGIGKHFHRCREFIYLLSGKLKITCYEKTFTLTPHQIFCADSFIPHSLTDLEENSTAIVTIIPNFLATDFTELFQKQFFEPALRNISYNKSVVLPLLKFFCMNQDINDVNKVTNPYKNRFTEKGMTNVIIGHLLKYKLTPKDKHDKNLKTLIAILLYINEHYKEDITLDKIAVKFNYNKYYISKLFNKNIGQNLRTYINTLRFQSLQTEISSSKEESATLENVMGDYGFSSSSTFYRTQKKIKTAYENKDQNGVSAVKK